MKKFISLLIITIFAGLVFWSCGSDDSSTEPEEQGFTCKITYPAPNTRFSESYTFTVNVEANDEDGSITEIRLFVDDQGISSDQTFPYSFDISTENFSLGEHVINVVAENNQGEEKQTSVSILVITTESSGEMIEIPTGSFIMGDDEYADDDESYSGPAHTVNITRAFYLGKYEVRVLDYNYVFSKMKKTDNPKQESFLDPIYGISWYDCIYYCNKRSILEDLQPCYTINNSTNPDDWGTVPNQQDSLWNSVTCNFDAKGYRLPTEAEWEYAARYNHWQNYPWGAQEPSVSLCNFSESSGVITQTGSYPLGNSQLGLCDMAGNVSEWCWDWWEGPYPSETQTNPTGIIKPTGSWYGRVYRGGDLYQDWGVMSIIRSAYDPCYSSNGVGGFRIARTK